MRARTKTALIVVVLVVLGSGGVWAEQGPVDLLVALESGQVWAQFRGAGPTALQGTVGRSPYGPANLSVTPGTQFQSQRPGVQGMTTFGSLNIDLSQRRIASIRIPAACTNIGLRTPTPADMMIPTACPNRRMARLTRVIARRKPPHPAAQLAVWAVANNPGRWQIEGYLREAANPNGPGAVSKRDKLITTAESLLREAGLRPSTFRMFE